MTAPELRLRCGVSMPQVALGTWPMVGREATDAVLHAIDAGYRHIDTAEQYGNEDRVGAAIRQAGIAREDLFITSKFNAGWHSREGVSAAFANAARRLGVDYLDLFLIHWPNPWLDRYIDAWQGLIGLHEAGHVRAIGVSNFLPAQLDRLRQETGVSPSVNQIELDPTLPRRELRAHHQRDGIVTEAWSPLARGGAVLRDPLVRRIAEAHDKSPAQVLLRWHIECGGAFAARSSDPRLIAENIAIFDFALDTGEMDRLAALDRGRAPAFDPETQGH